MLDFTAILTAFLNPTILIACLIVGWVIKNWISDANNQIIPTVVFILGIVLAVIVALTKNEPLTLDTFIMGAISGLASTGLHQMFKSWLNNFTQTKD